MEMVIYIVTYNTDYDDQIDEVFSNMETAKAYAESRQKLPKNFKWEDFKNGSFLDLDWISYTILKKTVKTSL
jgi:hypothetical protein